jgi:prepilin-type N-terminal cleavage/methylation domain-containing protein
MHAITELLILVKKLWSRLFLRAQRPNHVGKRIANSQDGVTLVELIVVLVILSIALSIVVPTLANNYETFVLRSAARRTVALFRFASDMAQRSGSDIAGYFDEQHFVLLRNGVLYRQFEMPPSIQVIPHKPGGAVFLPTGQILAAEPFVFKNARGRSAQIEVGSLPGQIVLKEGAE